MEPFGPAPPPAAVDATAPRFMPTEPRKTPWSTYRTRLMPSLSSFADAQAEVLLPPPVLVHAFASLKAPTSCEIRFQLPAMIWSRSSFSSSARAAAEEPQLLEA